MLLETYLRLRKLSLDKIIQQVDYSKAEIAEWEVIEYPDELLYVLAKQTRKEISLLLYELLHLESPIAIRRISEDYGLLKAFEGEAPYIYITRDYRKQQTKFLTDVLIEKEIYELDLGPLTKFNLVGQAIYETFLKSVRRSQEFAQIEDKLKGYFVLIHDEAGSLLCKTSYIRKNP